jgi:hypothetical protein
MDPGRSPGPEVQRLPAPDYLLDTLRQGFQVQRCAARLSGSVGATFVWFTRDGASCV